MNKRFGEIFRIFSGPDACLVWTEGLNQDGEIQSQWLPGMIVGEWERDGSFRTDATPEKGGKIVRVPDCIYRDKNIQATREMLA